MCRIKRATRKYRDRYRPSGIGTVEPQFLEELLPDTAYTRVGRSTAISVS